MVFKKVKRKADPSKVPFKSTLDVIHKDADVMASDLDARANTGDILLYANDMKAVDDWTYICVATSGKEGLERRLPIIHIAVIVRDVPPDILKEYGLEPDPEGLTTYVLEGVQPHVQIMHLKPWIRKQYKPELSGSHAFWRRRLSPLKVPVDEEFWQWVREAKQLPYANKWHMSEMWQGFFFMFVFKPDAFFALIMIIARTVRNTLLQSMGPGMARKAAAHLASWIAGLVLFGCFTTTLFYFGIPLAVGLLSSRLAQALNRNSATPYTKGYGVHPDGSLKFQICSVATGMTIKKMGLMDPEKPHPSLLLPKDFLPEGVGGYNNLFDQTLKTGVLYSDTLIRIANPFGPPPKKTFSPSMFVAAGQARKTLRDTMQMARAAFCYDLGEFQRNLAEGKTPDGNHDSKNQIQKSRLLRNTRLAQHSVFLDKPIAPQQGSGSATSLGTGTGKKSGLTKSGKQSVLFNAGIAAPGTTPSSKQSMLIVNKED